MVERDSIENWDGAGTCSREDWQLRGWRLDFWRSVRGGIADACAEGEKTCGMSNMMRIATLRAQKVEKSSDENKAVCKAALRHVWERKR